MKTKNVVALVLVTVTAFSSIACGDASMEDVGATGSASTAGVSNGQDCTGQLRETVCQAVGGQLRLFVCYDASQSGSGAALPQWGNSGKSCSKGHGNDAVANQGGTQNENQGGPPSGGDGSEICPDGPTRCNSAGKLENCDGPNGYYVASDQLSAAAFACHTAAPAPPATPPAGTTEPGCASSSDSSKDSRCRKNGLLKKCQTDGTNYYWKTLPANCIP